MSREKPIPHPKQIPDWFSEWPERNVVREMFSSGTRNYAMTILASPRRKLSWTPTGLRADVDVQTASWRLVGGEWRTHCSCGYRDGRCAHSYAAALLFSTVAVQEGWIEKKEGLAALKEKKEPVKKPEAVQEPQKEEPLFSEESVIEPPAEFDPETDDLKLEIEADFHHEEGLVAIRFYLKKDGVRNVMRLQMLRNWCSWARSSSHRVQKLPENDLSFLRWLDSRLSQRMQKRKSELRGNLSVLKLTRDEFEDWQDVWARMPERFIDRASQAFLTAGGNEPARLVFELRDEGPSVRIAAVVVTPENKRYDLPDVMRELAGGKKKTVLVVDGHLLDFTCPISRETLRQGFSRQNPKLKRGLIVKVLPTLLEGRLDLVEGDCVVRKHGKVKDVCIEVRPSGADILIRPSVGGLPISLKKLESASKIHESNKKFVITTFENTTVNYIRKILRSLNLREGERGTLIIPGNAEDVAQFAQAWREMPKDVRKKASSELAPLLNGPGEIKPYLDLRETGNFVDLQLDCDCNGTFISSRDVRNATERGVGAIRTSSGRWLAIDPDAARRVMEKIGEADFNLGGERLFRHDARKRVKFLVEELGAVIPHNSKDLANRLRIESEPITAPLPMKLRKILRGYQIDGFKFLSDRISHGVGAILADDMGLGKTLQVLALFEARRLCDPNFKSLVVCPASVVGVWLEQAKQFCPQLSCVASIGPNEHRQEVMHRKKWNVLVTNYSLLRRDIDDLRSIKFDITALDEAQFIKNPEAQVTQAAKSLRSERNLALTGTPLENRILDLWSIMDYLNPGFLGTRYDFLQRFTGNHAQLADRIAPTLLRRTKEEVTPELPERTEEVLYVELGEAQREAYETELVRARELAKTQGPIEILAAITRLREICCNPSLLEEYQTVNESAKTEALLEMLTEIIEGGHSALVFSQYTRMLERLRKPLEENGIDTLTITGDVPAVRRAALVHEFNEGKKEKAFLLSLRAAGTGLTLTRADYVFLFDPWWNPAVERQAIDRTHRIGQDKPVFAYRLVARDTIEEKVLAMQAEKAEIFANVVDSAAEKGKAGKLTTDELRRLLE